MWRVGKCAVVRVAKCAGWLSVQCAVWRVGKSAVVRVAVWW